LRVAIHTGREAVQSLRTAVRSGRETIQRLQDAIRSDRIAIGIDWIAILRGQDAVWSD
jgi:hypothetical protein